MPNVLIFRIELQNLSERDDRLMLLPGIGERDRQICQNELMIRRDPPAASKCAMASSVFPRR